MRRCFRLTDRRSVVALRNVEVLNGVRFRSNQPQELRIVAQRDSSSESQCELQGDFHARDGKLVEAGRGDMRGLVEFAERRTPIAVRRLKIARGPWKNVDYPPRGSKFYLGPPLRGLRKIRTGQGRAWGQIVAPLPVELAGSHRPAEGWILPTRHSMRVSMPPDCWPGGRWLRAWPCRWASARSSWADFRRQAKPAWSKPVCAAPKPTGPISTSPCAAKTATCCSMSPIIRLSGCPNDLSSNPASRAGVPAYVYSFDQPAALARRQPIAPSNSTHEKMRPSSPQPGIWWARRMSCIIAETS